MTVLIEMMSHMAKWRRDGLFTLDMMPSDSHMHDDIFY
jgi:hypothetical protein